MAQQSAAPQPESNGRNAVLIKNVNAHRAELSAQKQQLPQREGPCSYLQKRSIDRPEVNLAGQASPAKAPRKRVPAAPLKPEEK